MYKIFASIFATILISALLVPVVRQLAFRVGAVDKPNARRVNKKTMPTMGGLAIFIAFNFTNFVLLHGQYPMRMMIALFIAQCIVLITGIIDDIYELKPFQKLIGLTTTALVV